MKEKLEEYLDNYLSLAAEVATRLSLMKDNYKALAGFKVATKDLVRYLNWINEQEVQDD